MSDLFGDDSVLVSFDDTSRRKIVSRSAYRLLDRGYQLDEIKKIESKQWLIKFRTGDSSNVFAIPGSIVIVEKAETHEFVPSDRNIARLLGLPMKKATRKPAKKWFDRS